VVFNVLLNLSNEMILESPFDDLVEEIGRQQFMDVCPWEVGSERLYIQISARGKMTDDKVRVCTTTSSQIP